MSNPLWTIERRVGEVKSLLPTQDLIIEHIDQLMDIVLKFMMILHLHQVK